MTGDPPPPPGFAVDGDAAPAVPVAAQQDAAPPPGFTIDQAPGATAAPAPAVPQPAIPLGKRMMIVPGDNGAPTHVLMSASQEKAFGKFEANGYRDPTAPGGSASNPMTMWPGAAPPPSGTWFFDYSNNSRLQKSGDAKPQHGSDAGDDLGAGFVQGLRDVHDNLELKPAAWLNEHVPGAGTAIQTALDPLSGIVTTARGGAAPALKSDQGATGAYQAGPSADTPVAKGGRFVAQQGALAPLAVVTDGAAEGLIPAAEGIPVVGRAAAAGLKFVTGRAAPPLARGAPLLNQAGNFLARSASRAAAGAWQGAGANAAIGQDPESGAIAGGAIAPIAAPVVGAAVRAGANMLRPAYNGAVKGIPTLLDNIGAPDAADAFAQKFTPAVVPMPAKPQMVASTISRSLARRGVTVPDYIRAVSDSDGALPLSLGGRNLATLGEAAFQTPGPAMDIIGDAATARQMGSSGRVMDAVNTHLGVDPASASGDMAAIVQNGRDAVRPLFDAITSQPGPVWNSDLADLADRPSIQKAINTAAYNLKDEGVDPRAMGLRLDRDTGWTFSPKPGEALADSFEPQPTARLWDETYKVLGQNLERDRNGTFVPNIAGKGNASRGIATRDLRFALAGDPQAGTNGAMPGDYDGALNLSGDYLAPETAYKNAKGRLFNGTVDDFQTLWGNSPTPGEQGAIRGALANDVLDAFNRGKLQPGAFRAPGVRQKLQTAFGDQGVGPFIEEMERQAQERATYQKVMGGSQTALRQQAQQDAEHPGISGEDVADVLLAGHAAPIVAAAKAGRGMLKSLAPGGKSTLKDPEANAALGRALSDPEYMTSLLNAYQTEMARQARQQGVGTAIMRQGIPMLAPQVPSAQQQAQ